MIITKIIGGLGNQMFQWAFGKSLSLYLKVPMYLDTNGYANQIGLTAREFQLGLFSKLKYQIASGDDIRNYPKSWGVLKDRFYFNEIDRIIKGDIDCGLYLDGYWQSEKYFLGHDKEIRDILSMTYQESKNYKHLIEPDSVSIHIRRTDYVSSNGYHPVQPISYFHHGIDIIGDYNKMYVFSDDIGWCKTNLTFKNMVFMEGRTGLDDLRLMSLCSHNIISNSSFSWWAAWLNENTDKKVVAPSNWFGPQADLNTSDIIPEKWIKI